MSRESMQSVFRLFLLSCANLWHYCWKGEAQSAHPIWNCHLKLHGSSCVMLLCKYRRGGPFRSDLLRSPGCLWCLRHMRPRCKVRERPLLVFKPLELEDICVEYPDPPGDVPTYIRAWILQHRRLMESWKHLEIYRSLFCDLWG
jgi:hypothetical protein